MDKEVNIDIRDQEKESKNKRKQIKKNIQEPLQFPGLSDYLSISYLGKKALQINLLIKVLSANVPTQLYIRTHLFEQDNFLLISNAYVNQEKMKNPVVSEYIL